MTIPVRTQTQMFSRQSCGVLSSFPSKATRKDTLAAPLKYVQAQLRRFGIREDEAVFSSLLIRNGETVTLPRDSDRVGLWAARLTTPDLDIYKSWIGLPDEDIRSGQLRCAPRRPQALVAPHGWDQARELSPAQFEEVQRAGYTYLFDDSAIVQTYKPLIERFCGPLEVVVVLAKRVELLPGAVLNISGTPSILLFGELLIHEGGKVLVQTYHAATIGLVEKVNADI